eukprot:TRINITY_DN31003_c0_g1_i1.p1 TRINITY_DN31003_c0_g1~~TRINITY_DN31003_c0_g1_i1.p1  ORF type:complete len:219 (-),score=38.58 TRINITY_DN31003_c0_g1_i1:66-722(-)
MEFPDMTPKDKATIGKTGNSFSSTSINNNNYHCHPYLRGTSMQELSSSHKHTIRQRILRSKTTELHEKLKNTIRITEDSKANRATVIQQTGKFIKFREFQKKVISLECIGYSIPQSIVELAKKDFQSINEEEFGRMELENIENELTRIIEIMIENAKNDSCVLGMVNEFLESKGISLVKIGVVRNDAIEDAAHEDVDKAQGEDYESMSDEEEEMDNEY